MHYLKLIHQEYMFPCLVTKNLCVCLLIFEPNRRVLITLSFTHRIQEIWELRTAPGTSLGGGWIIWRAQETKASERQRRKHELRIRILLLVLYVCFFRDIFIWIWPKIKPPREDSNLQLRENIFSFSKISYSCGTHLGNEEYIDNVGRRKLVVYKIWT